MKQTTLSVNGLYKYFPVARTIIERLTFRPQKVVHAVDGVSFELQKGEIMALVGEKSNTKACFETRSDQRSSGSVMRSASAGLC